MSKGIRFSFVFQVISILLLIGCSGGSSQDSVSFELSSPPDVDWPNQQIEIDQLNLSAFTLDLVSAYDFSRIMIEDRYLVSQALHDTSIIIPESDCEGGGKLNIYTEKQAMTWSLALSYQNCRENAVTRNGSIIFQFSAESGYIGPGGFSILLNNYELVFSDDSQLSFYGSVGIDSYSSPSLMTLDLIAGSHNQFFKIEDFTVPLGYETEVGNYTGRVIDSNYGFAEVNVSDGFEFGEGYFWPVDGGDLTFSGKNNSVGMVEIMSHQEVYMELIRDDTQPQALWLTWDDLDIESPPLYGETPSAAFAQVHVQGEELLTADVITLDASDSHDPENKLLTYTWTLLAGPEGHNSSLSDEHSPRPKFYPDRIGTYQIQLVVNDGGNTSQPFIGTVTLDTLNYRARAEWRSSQDIPDVANNYKLTRVPISIDASLSQMMLYPNTLDYINLTYSWHITESPDGSLVSISDPASVESEFTPDLPGYYTVNLVVNDGVNDAEKSYRFRIHDYELYRPTVSRSSHAFGNAGEPLTINLYGGSTYGPRPQHARWSLLSAPPDSSVVLLEVDGLRMTFTPDVSGMYTFEVVAYTDIEESDPIEIIAYVEEESLFETQTILDASNYPSTGYGWIEPKELFLSDVNNDSYTDLILPSARSEFAGVEELRILLRNDDNTGFLESTTSYELPNPRSGAFKLEQLENDNVHHLFHSYYTGEYELFQVDANTSPLSVWTTTNSTHLLSSQGHVLFHDFNKDGFKDLVTLDSYLNFSTIPREFNLRLHEGLSTPSYASPITFDLEDNRAWFDMGAVDLNKDGNEDLILNSYNYQPSIPGSLEHFEEIVEILYFQGDGEGSFSEAQSIILNGEQDYYITRKPKYVDLDNDGDIDVIGLTRNHRIPGGYSGVSYWLQDDNGRFNLSGTILHEPASSVIQYLSDLHVLDLDLDGLLDVVVLNRGYLHVFLQTAIGEFDHGQSYLISTYRQNKLVFSDIDNDGDQDIYASGLTSGGVEILEFKNTTIR